MYKKAFVIVNRILVKNLNAKFLLWLILLIKGAGEIKKCYSNAYIHHAFNLYAQLK